MRFLPRRTLCRLAAVAAALTATAGADAADDTGWASGPQTLVSGGFSVQNLSAGGSSATLLVFTPGVRYVAASRLVFGADLQLTHISSGGDTTGVAFVPALGFDVVLSGDVSLVPQLELYVNYMEVGSRSLTRFGIGAFVPVLVHPAGHFFIGFGPEVLADLSASLSGGGIADKQTSIGAKTVLGAWF